jgi:hypothetical protein
MSAFRLVVQAATATRALEGVRSTEAEGRSSGLEKLWHKVMAFRRMFLGHTFFGFDKEDDGGGGHMERVRRHMGGTWITVVP